VLPLKQVRMERRKPMDRQKIFADEKPGWPAKRKTSAALAK